ncbi:hypothetical protein [Halovenus marina]|uniref:hypothetical protein n=1 Tax=Halovenus marina TaxID=3396621 RepID=UPI003F55DD66
MTDITTIETVEAGDYSVRVGQSSDGTAYEAVVIDDGSGSTSRSDLFGHPLITLSSSSSDDDGEDVEPIGPPVTAPHRWVAVGFAIEAHEFGAIGEEPVDVEEAYTGATLNGEPLHDVIEFEMTFEGGDVDANE